MSLVTFQNPAENEGPGFISLRANFKVFGMGKVEDGGALGVRSPQRGLFRMYREEVIYNQSVFFPRGFRFTLKCETSRGPNQNRYKNINLPDTR